ncbi:hypothetical protein C1637_19090 [Chryseobacterium lactis]|uniref:DUF695 domain-containing protein n=1 Tax=Chryseobacterium lactis TaxID=1241981 RepID=A0A3G6RTS8_CHRLC|nr:hypothetical protein [Chryseobacterium lactis]AZA84888.1 hypothetical protein EG342_24600 [Chryseobacterium lactis]AZB05276.1 hypothetical protein EG341_15480 [Chryseobacterium lactis]PNW12259.1 hypothetical protein C1637_19090 [Chryseobacterium lactis]
MVLGVYWYFKFPENLYHFNFFKFFEGFGGHADNDAELIAKVRVDHIDHFIQKLETLKEHFKRTFLQLNIDGNQLIISIGDHQLFDYHFQFALEIENLLSRENAVLIEPGDPFKIQNTKVYHPEREQFKRIEYNFIQIVGSDFKKNNAEILSIRIDCNLPLVSKKDFLHDVVLICKDENLNIFYYNDYDFEDQCNLMLFFTNGRQYKDGIQTIDINSFGNKIRSLTQKYQFHFGHFGGLKYYPLNGPHIELMEDENFILN